MYRQYVHAVSIQLQIKHACQIQNSIANNYDVGIRWCYLRTSKWGHCRSTVQSGHAMEGEGNMGLSTEVLSC